jgi:hypothetical protein
MKVIVGAARFFNPAGPLWQGSRSRPGDYEGCMATLTIDGQEHSATKPLKTLGDLVAEADEGLAHTGRIVTALRLDGVDEPAFREPQVVGQSTARYARVEIDSGTPADLAARCLVEAGTALKSLAEAADSVAMLYRVGEIDDANRQLAAITEGIGTALAITGAASLGLGVDLGALVTTQGTLGALTAATIHELEALIGAQLASDWEAAADLLDAGLSPLLRQWSAACSVLVPQSAC